MLENRVPLKIKGRTRAAIPTDVPGLFIVWWPFTSSYAIAHHSGRIVADGWASVWDADSACDEINGMAPWDGPVSAIEEIPLRRFVDITTSVFCNGGRVLSDAGQYVRPLLPAEVHL